MGAVSMRDDSSAKFVGQVLDRKSPVLEFRAAPRVNDDLPLPPVSEARVRSSADLDSSAHHRHASESEVRLSLRPMRLPVLSVQRRTRIDLVAIAPARTTWRVAQRAARLALAVATGLALLTLVALGARAAMPGPTMFTSYLAENASTKSLRAEMRVDGLNAKIDSIAPSIETTETEAPAPIAKAARAHGKAHAVRASEPAAHAVTHAKTHTNAAPHKGHATRRH